MKFSTLNFLSFVFHFYVFIHPLRFALPSVKLESLTLRGHRMTSSHSSKDPLRPPVSGGQLAGAVVVFSFPFVTNSPPETGASTPQGGGGGCFLSFRTLHAASLLPRRIGRKFSVYKVSFPFSHFRFLSTPSASLVPPVSGGQLAGAVIVFSFLLSPFSVSLR